MSARILDVTPAEYHADPCEKPSLSSSIAKLLLNKSPSHAWAKHPRLGGLKVVSEDGDEDTAEAAPDEHTKPKDNGKLMHRLLLGKGTDVEIVYAKDWRTNAAKAQRAEARSSGRLAVLEKQYEQAQSAAERLREMCTSRGFELNGLSEVAIEWTEQGVDGPVLCRSMIDHLKLDEGVIYDIKAVANAKPESCGRSFVDMGFDLQYTSYIRAVEQLYPHLIGRVQFYFLYLETFPPYAVVPAQPDGRLRDMGLSRWGRAVRLWEHCLARNHWPSYTDDVAQISAPPWVVTQELGNEYA